MSASLVGSEMCIRDSCLPFAAGPVTPLERPNASSAVRRRIPPTIAQHSFCLLYTSDAADDM
eukprot:15369780-Alexandrium_andersonii.AAC.1